ncbi:keratin, type II cytoskeletal 1-like [Vitis riparia]|uniref:keratin, type II cytoskeletal 1-like n=1 Tax=Vitis riparia TaxID=96939 RepID=UPI00155AF07F|nr:keratin, type II cytoskeletal 1-like [Vitis riparia]
MARPSRIHLDAGHDESDTGYNLYLDSALNRLDSDDSTDISIPFNAVDSGPYYQSMIDTIVEASPDIKGPTGYQIGNAYLEEEVQELEFSNHSKIKVRLKEVIKRLEADFDRQAKAINEVKLFVDGRREFGSTLTKKEINQPLPGLPTNEEGRETIHEDDGATNRRVGRCTSNATQERDVDSRRKGKASRKISSSSSSDDGDNEGNKRGGGTSGGNRGIGGTGEGTGGYGSTGGGYELPTQFVYSSYD